MEWVAHNLILVLTNKLSHTRDHTYSQTNKHAYSSEMNITVANLLLNHLIM